MAFLVSHAIYLNIYIDNCIDWYVKSWRFLEIDLKVGDSENWVVKICGLLISFYMICFNS